MMHEQNYQKRKLTFSKENFEFSEKYFKKFLQKIQIKFIQKVQETNL
jgi:hypothetical protein